MPAFAGRTPGSVDQADPQARGLPEGTSCRRRRRQPTAGREEGSRQQVIFASAWATASSTRCKRAALHELCWFDSNPMHQSMVSVVQSARTPECDSGGRGFEPRPSPHLQFRRRLGFETPVLPWRAGSRAGGGADQSCAHSSIGSERRITSPGVRGSSPRGRTSHAGVAKRPKASACRADIHGFESRRPRQPLRPSSSG